MDGREERFRRVFEECYAPLTAYARRRVPADDADDVVAEALTVAWRRLPDVPEGAGMLPWMYAVASRVVANHHRSRGRRARLTLRLAGQRPAPAPVPGETGDPALERAMAKLRPDDREVLRLAAWEQLAPADLAVVLGCSVNAATLRLSRARQRLRRLLTETDPSRTQAGVEEAL